VDPDRIAGRTFAEVAGDLVALLRGRVVVAHDFPGVAGFLRYEFARLGVRVPLRDADGVCTMWWSGRLLPGAPRSRTGCCTHAGIRLDETRGALTGARATAALLHSLNAIAPPAGIHHDGTLATPPGERRAAGR